MTFKFPFGFLGAIFTFFLSRESPSLTLRSGIRTAAMYIIGMAYTIVGVMTMVGSPITHFIWIMISLFVAFYLIRIFPDYFSAVAFGFTLAGSIPLWDQAYLTVEQRTENTLWLGGRGDDWLCDHSGGGIHFSPRASRHRHHPRHREQAAIGGRVVAADCLRRAVLQGQ